MSFVQRNITLTFTLGGGGAAAPTTITLPGLRVQTSISMAGSPGATMASIRAYGVSLSIINKLSTIGWAHQSTKTRNDVQISAGDATNGMGVVFNGGILEAYADFGSPPAMALSIIASSGSLARMQPVQASSFSGTVDVATIMASFATQYNYYLENNGVNVKLSNPYFKGTLSEQIATCARAAGIGWHLDDIEHVIAIWPRNGARSGTPVVFSAENGLIGYPAYQRMGPIVRSVLRPGVRFWGLMQVQSAVVPASGIWRMKQINYELDSQTPDGAWEMTVYGLAQNVQ